MDIFGALLERGNFDHIVIRILGLLDGASLESAALVCKRWRDIILQNRNAPGLSTDWSDGVAISTFRRVSADSSSARAIALACDATHCVLGFDDGLVRLMFRGGEENDCVTIRTPGSLSSLCLSAHFVMTGGYDGSVDVWRKCDGSSVVHLHPHESAVTAMHIFCDVEPSKLFSSSRDGSVAISELSLDASDQIHVATALSRMRSNDAVLSLSVDVANDRLAAGCTDAVVVIWSIADFHVLRELKARLMTAVQCVQLAGPLCAHGSNQGDVFVWDVESGRCLIQAQHGGPVTALAFNSSVLVAADDSADLFLWDMKGACTSLEPSEPVLHRALTGHVGHVLSIVITPTSLVSGDSGGVVCVKDFTTCIHPQRNALRMTRADDGVNCMASDGSIVVCGLINRKVVVYDLATLSLLRRLEGHADHVWSVDLDRDVIVSGSWDCTAKVWLRTDGSLVVDFRFPDDREVRDVRILGDRILVASVSSLVAIFKKRSGVLDYVLDGLATPPGDFGLLYASVCDGKRIISSYTKTGGDCTILAAFNVGDSDAGLLDNMESFVSDHRKPSFIIWGLHVVDDLVLACHENDAVDVYALAEDTRRIRTLRHPARALDAKLHDQTIVVGCQYGYMVLWRLEKVTSPDCTDDEMAVSKAMAVISAHPAAIAKIIIFPEEIISGDYNGNIIVRKLSNVLKR